MYDLIVVDDEDIIREGMVNSVPWQDFGFRVAGEASNGLEAINLIVKQPVDVIITDIKMPEMDGIALIEYLNTHYPDIKIVILSGYDELEYLRKAIKNKVTEYLLKPTNYDEFVKVFESVKQILDGEKKQNEENEMLRKRLVESLPYMKEKFLNDLVNGLYKEEGLIDEKSRFYELDVNNWNLLVVVIGIDYYHSPVNNYIEEYFQLLKLAVVEIANHIFETVSLGIFFTYNSKEIVGICSTRLGTQGITKAIQEVQKYILKNKNITISAGISEECCNIFGLHSAYRQAVHALKQKVFLGAESIVFNSDIILDMNRNNPSVDINFNTEKISNIIFYQEDGNLLHELNLTFEKFENRMMIQHEYIDMISLELLFYISRQAQAFNIEIEEILEEKQSVYQKIFSLDSLDAKKEWLFSLLDDIQSRMVVLRKDKSSALVQEIKRYVKENFYNNTMSLELVADKVKKNMTYLSRLFKLETGENFIDFLIGLRINKAKELLKDFKYKIYEISSMVGYAEVSHFTKVFKRCTGYSPAEYRDVMGAKIKDGI